MSDRHKNGNLTTEESQASQELGTKIHKLISESDGSLP